MTRQPTDADETTARIQVEWSTGSYPTLARVFLPVAATLVEAADVRAGERVLDVACGTGNVALTAERRGAVVTGVDITPAMLASARERAAVTDAAVDWRAGDAAALPLADDAFEVTLSCLGHMFVHDADAAASELVRVTEPGGRIGFVAWTPTSGVAAMMRVLSTYVPPRPDPPPAPYRWGDPEVVSDRLGDAVESVRFETGTVRYPAVSPAHFWDSMTTDSGAILLALDDVEPRARAELDAAARETLADYFVSAANAVDLEYLLVTASVG